MQGVAVIHHIASPFDFALRSYSAKCLSAHTIALFLAETFSREAVGTTVRRCQSCHRNNPDDASFCSSCGASLLGATASGFKPVPSAEVRELQWPIVQYLEAGEHLLFSSEKAEIIQHESIAAKIGRRLAVGSQTAAGHDPNEVRRSLPPPKTGWGSLAITDRRIYIASSVGLFSKHLRIALEAIYDPTWAKQRIESVTASNAAIREQAKNVRVFSRGKFMAEQGYQTHLNVLTTARLQKGTFGGESLLLKVYRVYVAEDIRKQMKFRARLFGDKHVMKINEMLWDLRIKRPLSIATGAAVLGLALTPLAPAQWFGAILLHYKGKANISYEPILDILQAKAEELSGLVKQLEAAAA
jgi:hypothetical protein